MVGPHGFSAEGIKKNPKICEEKSMAFKDVFGNFLVSFGLRYQKKCNGKAKELERRF